VTTGQQSIDKGGTISREKALAVRNAYLALLRAFEDLYDLPRSVPSKDERGEVRKVGEVRGHHNR
jgi:hypothetical protein